MRDNGQDAIDGTGRGLGATETNGTARNHRPATKPTTSTKRDSSSHSRTPASARGQSIKSRNSHNVFGPSGIAILADIPSELVAWLWTDRIPLGKLTIIEGNPDEGKTALLIDIAARVTRGERLPFDDEERFAESIIFLTAEDGLGDTIHPRMKAAGADMRRVVVFDPERLPTIPDELAILEAAVRKVDARLVVIDPFVAFLADRVDANKDHSVRRALTPLAALAQRTGAAIVAIRHLNKGSGPAKFRGGGSIGFTGAARSVMVAAPLTGPRQLLALGLDPQPSATCKVLARVKCNLAPPCPSLVYRLIPAGASVRVEWIRECDLSADDALSMIQSAPSREHPRDAATALLLTLLHDRPMPVSAVTEAAARASISKKTLRRAKMELGVISRRKGFGAAGSFEWSLPPRSPITKQPDRCPA